MIAGRLSKSNINTVLTGNTVKRKLKLALTPEELHAETMVIANRSG